MTAIGQELPCLRVSSASVRKAKLVYIGYFTVHVIPRISLLWFNQYSFTHIIYRQTYCALSLPFPAPSKNIYALKTTPREPSTLFFPFQFPPHTLWFPPNTTRVKNLGGVVPHILTILTNSVGRWYVVYYGRIFITMLSLLYLVVVVVFAVVWKE